MIFDTPKYDSKKGLYLIKIKDVIVFSYKETRTKPSGTFYDSVNTSNTQFTELLNAVTFPIPTIEPLITPGASTNILDPLFKNNELLSRR